MEHFVVHYSATTSRSSQDALVHLLKKDELLHVKKKLQYPHHASLHQISKLCLASGQYLSKKHIHRFKHCLMFTAKKHVPYNSPFIATVFPGNIKSDKSYLYILKYWYSFTVGHPLHCHSIYWQNLISWNNDGGNNKD